MPKSSVRITSVLSSKWVGSTSKQIDTAVADMAATIHARASMLAPEASGALVNSGRLQRVSTGFWKVVYGSSRVPYARQRHFENKKNPQTLRYLEKAGDSVARGNVDKFLRKF